MNLETILRSRNDLFDTLATIDILSAGWQTGNRPSNVEKLEAIHSTLLELRYPETGEFPRVSHDQIEGFWGDSICEIALAFRELGGNTTVLPPDIQTVVEIVLGSPNHAS